MLFQAPIGSIFDGMQPPSKERAEVTMSSSMTSQYALANIETEKVASRFGTRPKNCGTYLNSEPGVVLQWF